MNDFARYSKKPNSPYIQLLVIPVVFIVMMLFGIVGANGSLALYGELLWDPLLIVNEWTSKVCDPETIEGTLAKLQQGRKSSSFLLRTCFPNRLNRRQHLRKLHLRCHRSLRPPPQGSLLPFHFPSPHPPQLTNPPPPSTSTSAAANSSAPSSAPGP